MNGGTALLRCRCAVLPLRGRAVLGRVKAWSDSSSPIRYLEGVAQERPQQVYGGRVHVNWRAFNLRLKPVTALDAVDESPCTSWQRGYPMARA